MKTHTTHGAQTLEAALAEFPNADFLAMACDIALYHHERYNGQGYPCGLVGTAIPLCARIVALADVYDALTSKRVYKAAMSHAEAASLIIGEKGKHFDPEVVDAFVQVADHFLAIATSAADHDLQLPKFKNVEQVGISNDMFSDTLTSANCIPVNCN